MFLLMRLELYEVFICARFYSVHKNVCNHQDLFSGCADCCTVFYLYPCFHPTFSIVRYIRNCFKHRIIHFIVRQS